VIQPDGWLKTGDLGMMREDGCLHLTGRSRDVIIRGGENIYPREVEEFLYTHPKVSEVQVVGIPNARLGEIVAAWVRLRPGHEATEEEIRDWCQGQIAYYKIPEHIRFVDDFLPAWRSCVSILASLFMCTKSIRRCHASTCSGLMTGEAGHIFAGIVPTSDRTSITRTGL